MITLQALLNTLNDEFSFYKGFEPGYNGLQVEGKLSITKIAFAVSASLEVIEKAKLMGADALIVHHGLFWSKDSPLIIGHKKKRLSFLLNNEISLIAYHLPLDAHPIIGNNAKAAKDMGLSNVSIFYDIGAIGECKEQSFEEFVMKLEAYYENKAHIAKARKNTVSKVAIISGGAHKMIEEAAQQGADCFVTGSFDEPIWDLAKELNIHFAALGHHATERVGIKALMQLVQAKVGVECFYVDVQNPF